MRFSLPSSLSSELPSKLKTKLKSKVKHIAKKLHIHNHKRQASVHKRPSCGFFKHVSDDEPFSVRPITIHNATGNTDESFPFRQISHHKATINNDDSFPFCQTSITSVYSTIREDEEPINYDERNFADAKMNSSDDTAADTAPDTVSETGTIVHHPIIPFPANPLLYDINTLRDFSLHLPKRREDTAADTASDTVPETGTNVHHPIIPFPANPWLYDINTLQDFSLHLPKRRERCPSENEPVPVNKQLRCISFRSISGSHDYATRKLFKDAGEIILKQLTFAYFEADGSGADGSDALVDRPLPATASSKDRGLHFEEVKPLLVGKPPTELHHPRPERSAKSFLETWDNVF
ncbi:MAG: hypothetical protein LQ351_007006 [Letrouitia transgressa]|nr:MAG: hypothetical protein LQ351_007006 [Letrouitia transgressa]